MSKHTPGPWRADLEHGYEPGVSYFVRTDSDSKIVAEVWAPGGGFLTQRENTVLIAAAPELLNACEAVRDCGPIIPIGVLEQLRSAISKARGESA